MRQRMEGRLAEGGTQYGGTLWVMTMTMVTLNPVAVVFQLRKYFGTTPLTFHSALNTTKMFLVFQPVF